MKRPPVIALLVTATLFVVTLPGEVVDVFMDLSFEDALQLADKQDKIVMVKFHADWCYWCQKMERDTFANPNVQNSLGALIPIRVNVDEKRGLNLAREAGVVGLPTIVFYDSDGRILGNYAGFRSARQLMDILKRHQG